MSPFLLWSLLACGLSDPRPGIAAHFPPNQRTTLRSPEVALREERPAEACMGWQVKLKESPKDEESWAGMLTAAARTHCLEDADGDLLSGWGATRAGSLWNGPRAEWLAYRGDAAGARALAASAPAAARLRVGLRLGDHQMVLEAAEEVLTTSPGNIMACRILTNDALQKEELFRAIEEADCSGIPSPDLTRLAAHALDLAGLTTEAEARFRQTDAKVHLAVLLYQSNPTPERIAEAHQLLDNDPMPPAILHRGWMHLLGFGPLPDLSKLDDSPDAKMLKAAVQLGALPAADIEALAGLPGAAPLVLQAQLAALVGRKDLAHQALKEAMAREPFFEPVFRSAVAISLSLKEDPSPLIAAWKMLDPDHIALRGNTEFREVPWEAIAPWTWVNLHQQDARVPETLPLAEGQDEIGQAWRAAQALPDRNARIDAITVIQTKERGLRQLAALRYQIEAGIAEKENSIP